MANPTALILLLIIASAHNTVAATTTTLFRDKTCITEIEKMSKWECLLWLLSEYGRDDAFLRSAADNRGDPLQPCCNQLNSLSSNCRCEAIWAMRKAERKYGDLPCKLPEQCGFRGCANCPGGRLPASELHVYA